MNDKLEIGGAIVYRYSPRSHTVYLNVTNRCSNRCNFCVKNFSIGLSGYKLWLDREPTIDEIWLKFQDEVNNSDKEVVWCGFGEPTIRLDMILNLTRKIKIRYPYLRIRLDTDGLAQLRNKNIEVAKELKQAGIDSVSISLNAENEDKYERLCNPTLPRAYKAVINFAKECKKYFSEVKLSVVNVEGIDITKCKKIAEELSCGFKVRG